MARGTVKLSILSTYDDKGAAQAERAMQRFAKKYGTVATDGAKATATLDATTAALARQSVAFDQAAAKWAGYSKKAAALSRSLAPLSAAAAAVGAASIKMAVEYEQGLAKVSTIMDRTAMSADEMGKALLQVSTDTGRGVGEIEEATYQALSASVDTAKSVDFVRQAVNLSKAGFTETSTSVDVLTTAINAYGLSADDAASLSDKLVQAQNAGKTTVDQLGQSLGQVIPTAAAYGVNIDQLLTGYVQMTKQGINTANSTTYLNRMLTELNKSGSTVDKTLREKTGRSFRELMDDGASLGDVMEILMDAAGGDSVAFANLWSSAVAGRGALAIANAGADEFNRQLNIMEHSAGTVDRALKDLETPASQAGKAINALKNTGIELGEVFLAALAPAAERAKDAAHGLYEWFSNLDDATKNNIAGAVAFTAALAPAIMLFSKFAGVVSKGYKALAVVTAWMAKATAATYAHVVATEGEAAAQAMSTAQMARATVAMKAQALGAKALAAAQTLAKGAIVAMVAAGVVFAIQKFGEWIEEQKQLYQATAGLENAQRRAASSFKLAAAGAQQTAISYGEMHDRASAVIASQADLARGITDTFTEANRSAAELDAYAATIGELANKSNLSTEEQARLVMAVDGLNAAAGTTYEVVDAAHGAIVDETGAVIDNVDAINKLVAAKKREIQAEALASAAKDAYKAQADAMAELTQAQANLTAAQENYNKAAAAGDVSPEEMLGYASAVDQAQAEVDRLQKAYDSATDAADSFSDQQEVLAMGSEAVGDSLAAAISETNGFATTMSANGKSVKTFYQQLKAAGVTGDQFKTLTSQQLSTLASKYDGTFASIEGELRSYGIDVKGAETQTRTSMANSTAAVANSGLPAAATTTMGNAVNALFNGASKASGAGAKLSSSARSGIDTTAANGRAVSLMKNARDAAAGVSAYSTGKNFSAGIASGIRSGVTLIRSAAQYVAEQAKKKADNTLSVQSPSRVMMETGAYFSEGFALGIRDQADAAVRAAQVMAQGAADAANVRAAAPMLQAANASTLDGARLVAAVDALTARVDQLDRNLGATIANNAPVVVEPEREFARRVRKAAAYE